ncbi:pickpocket protein 28-like [Culex pipiens pallens]|uniref:pickpocket protein 28-like n=1 Tax=Culex pipiens pallens TaxID=42434 RepID=UPI001954E90F|nr:pickpocket protein 28-like [Culex pipiens pallens]
MQTFKKYPDWRHVLGPNNPLMRTKSAHHFARKPIHADGSKWRNVKKFVREFCTESTIHGLRNIEAGKTLLERLWWLTVVVLSVVACGMLIQKVYHKWANNPVIVSYDDTATKVWTIPFPAITVCPEAKFKVDVMNFTEAFYQHFHSSRTLDKKSHDRLMAMLQICDDFFHIVLPYQERYPNSSLDVVALLNKISVDKSSTIIVCRKGTDMCRNQFFHTLTEDGVCFTYNGFSAQDMFNEGVLHNEYEYLTETNSATNWTLENGYAPGTPFTTHPLRASGYASRLRLNLASFKSNVEAHCAEEQGFKVVLHSPDEYPIPFAKYVLLSLDRDINIAIRPQILTTSKELASYSPARRQCYFSHERTLKFFRVYNQNNCELECLTNYTLAKCGCVKFSMPRSAGTRICSTAEQRCIIEARYGMLKALSQNRLNNDGLISECDCMSACSSIQYLTEITQSTYDSIQTVSLRLKPLLPQLIKPMESVTSSKVSVFFKGAEFLSTRRNELFGLTDFVANCGGILGLCLGISFVSLVELLYYCIVRPVQMARKSTGRNWQVVMVREKSGDQSFVWRDENQ